MEHKVSNIHRAEYKLQYYRLCKVLEKLNCCQAHVTQWQKFTVALFGLTERVVDLFEDPCIGK